jgi:hypothetical protein
MFQERCKYLYLRSGGADIKMPQDAKENGNEVGKDERANPVEVV